MKVYIVHIDSYDYFHNIDDLKCFDTMEKAKKHLELCKREFEKEILGFYDSEDCIVEEDDLSYVWYLEGYYDSDHYCITIHTKEIE